MVGQLGNVLDKRTIIIAMITKKSERTYVRIVGRPLFRVGSGVFRWGQGASAPDGTFVEAANF